MWLLGHLLPLMVGDCVPDDDHHWICFVNLLRILCVGTAVEITPEAIDILQMLTMAVQQALPKCYDS